MILLRVLLAMMVAKEIIGGDSIRPKKVNKDLLSVSSEAVNNMLREVQSQECSVIIVTNIAMSLSSTSKLSGISAKKGVAVASTLLSLTGNHTELEFATVLRKMRKLRQWQQCLSIILVSSEQKFLQLFAKISASVRLLVWSTKVVIVTDLSFLKLRDVLGNFKSFSAMNAMAVSIRNVGGHTWCDIYSYLPYSPSGPFMKRMAYWTSSDGLIILEKAQLFPPKYENFYGAKKWVTAIMIAPYVIKKIQKNVAGEEEAKISGREYLLLQAVADTLNISFTFNQVSQAKEMPKDVRKGAFAGVMRVAMLPIFMKAVEFSVFVQETTFTFCMAKPTLEPQWQSIYYPLTNTVWACVIALFFAVPIILKIVTKKDFEHDTNNELAMANKHSTVLMIFGMFLGQDMAGGLPKTTSTRVLLVSWLIFGFIVATAYRGNLTAFLTIPKYPPRIETLEQLARSNSRAKFRPNSTSFYNYFRESELFSFSEVYKRADLIPTVTHGLHEALENKAAYFQERMNMDLEIASHYPDLRKRSKFYIAKENVMPGFAAWMVPHDAPYKDNVDKVIMTANEAGLLQKWIDNVMRVEKREIFLDQQQMAREGLTVSIDEGEPQDEKGEGNAALTLVHLQGPLFLVPLGLAAATLTFLVEVIANRFAKRARKQKAKAQG